MAFEQNDRTKKFIKDVKSLIDSGFHGTLKDIAGKLNYNYSALNQIYNGNRNAPVHLFIQYDKIYKEVTPVPDSRDEIILLLKEQNVFYKEQLKTSLGKIEFLLEHLQKVGNVNQAYLKAHVDGFLAHRKVMEKKDYTKEFDKVVADNLGQILERGK